jgi:hypothetical protein
MAHFFNLPSQVPPTSAQADLTPLEKNTVPGMGVIYLANISCGCGTRTDEDGNTYPVQCPAHFNNG